MNQEYETFALLVGPVGADGYPVTVIESPAGEEIGLLRLNPQDGELKNALALIENRAMDGATLAQIGNYLFEELFAEPVRSLYRDSLAMVRQNQSRLRLRLRLEAPELAALPWEYLHDPEENRFLAVSGEIALLRFIPLRLPARPIAVTPPLRVLVVISNPQGVPRLDVARELAIISEALAESVGLGLMELHFVERAVVAEINQAMRTVQPHVFHFIGHGHFDGERASVLLEDEDGQAKPIDELLFREFFEGCKETRLAFLNACQSAATSSSRPLAGLAPNLLHGNLSAVIAMQYPITDAAALIFSREFYRSLAAGRPVDVAVSEARKGIFIELGADQPDWGIPVLFLRAKDGQIFRVEQPAQTNAPTIPAPLEPAKPPTMEGFVGREAELARYAAALESYGIAVVAGMPGVGKTALVSVLAQRFCAADKLFWHTFLPGEGVDSILWKLAAFLAWHDRPSLWEMFQGIVLSGGALPPPDVLLDHFLQTLKGQGYLLVLDNVQFVIDDPRLERLIDRVRSVVQSGELRLILVSQRVPDFVQLAKFDPLPGLSLRETESFFESCALTLDPGIVVEMHKRTHGNVQLLKLVAAACEKIPPERLLERLLISQDVERFLLSEVDQRLTESEKEVMGGLAALLGFPSNRDAIEEVLDGQNVRRQLTALVNQYLLEMADGAVERKYNQHAIVQAFYYDLLSRRQRQAMHQRAAAYYELEEVDDLRAALHYQYAGDPAKAALLATRDVWLHINQGHTRPLLSLLDELKKRDWVAEPILWIKVLLARGVAYGYLEQNETARSVYEEALALLDKNAGMDETPTLRAQACRGIAYTLRQRSAATALDWIEKGLAAIGDAASPQRADLLIQRGISLRMMGETDAALASLTQALAMLPPGAAYERMLAQLNLGYLYFHSGKQSEAIAAEEQALALARQTKNAPNELIITSNLAAFHHVAGDWQAAATGYTEAVALAQKLGNRSELVRAEVNRGVLALYRGDLKTAQAALHFSLNDARQRSNVQTIVTSLLYLAACRRR